MIKTDISDCNSVQFENLCKVAFSTQEINSSLINMWFWTWDQRNWQWIEVTVTQSKWWIIFKVYWV